jgi:DNA-binding CsgD family transcriptional regulator
MSRRTILWALFALQALCCAYFLMDIFWDLILPMRVNVLAESDALEAAVTIALFFGLAFTANELRLLMTRHQKLTDQIDIASGAFAQVLESRFTEWQLTAAERDIAILSLKGFSIAEMANLRDTKEGTVKAQCAALYRKADVSGRVQLLSLFLDDLLAGSIVEAAGSKSS